MRINLGLTTYESQSKSVLSERVVNLYAEQLPQEAKSPAFLIGTPGLDLFCDIGTDPIYGLHEMTGVLYAVSGDNFYSINSSGVETNIGSIGTVTGNVEISNNGLQIMIVKPDTTAWVYTLLTNTLQQITDDAFPGATTVSYISSLNVVSKPSSGEFWWSGILDALSWDGLNFATAESSPDNLVAVFAAFGELWLFGDKTSEIWYATGNADSPLQRVNNGVVELGCAAKFSPANDGDAVYWLADDRTVRRAQGYSPKKISNSGIDRIIQNMQTVDDAFGFTYLQDGHNFYCIIFPTEERTFVYDTLTMMWHERESYLKGRWRANNFAQAYSRLLIGDFETGKIYALNLNTYTENGERIERINTFPPVWMDDARIVFDKLYVDFEAGQGLVVGQGSDPQAMLDWSGDGGFTFSNQHWRSMGKLGAYHTRCYWRRLGQDRERIFRVKITDPIKVRILGAYVDVRVGKS